MGYEEERQAGREKADRKRKRSRFARSGNAALDDTENIRIAYLGTIAPGKSEVTFKLSVPSSEETDVIEIKGLKASGFTGGVLPGQGSGLVTDCDEFTPPEECETLPF